MAPRYKEIDVPQASEELFEQMVGQMGGSFGEKIKTLQERRDLAIYEWNKQRNAAMERVQQFKVVLTDPERAEGIKRNLRKLVSDMLLLPYVRARGIKIDALEIDGPFLVALFERSLPETMPKYIVPRGTAILGRSAGDRSNALLPRQISLLIDVYGLDGEQRSLQSVGESFGITRKRLTGALERVRYMLLSNRPAAPRSGS